MSVCLSFLLLHISLSVVYSEIQWVHMPKSTAVLIGQDVLLNCVAKSDDQSTVVYSWYKNNQSIPEHLSLYANHSLLIPQISYNDLGGYHCVIFVNGSQPEQVVSPEAFVIEAYIKDFVLHPQSVQVAENEVVSFDCVTGQSAPSPMVFWELNGVRFKGGNQSHTSYGNYDESGLRIQYSLKLRITLKPEYVGNVRCVAENPVTGKIIYSHSANISITSTPALPVIEIAPPSEVIASRGHPLILPCHVTGYPQTHTMWFKDGVSINGSSNSHIAANGSLVFFAVMPDDSGSYTCKGINTVGETESPSCNVTVTYLNITFVAEPEGVTVFAGQPTTLHCTPPDSYPPATVTWYKDYKPITASVSDNTLQENVVNKVSAMSVLRTGNGAWDLFIPSVQKSDAGWYFCVATNNLSTPVSRTSKQAHLKVVGAPTITEPPVDIRIVKGRLLHLICHVEADPTPSIEWRFLEQTLKASTHISFRDRNQELFITNINKAWDGLYTCIATNKYGSKSADAKVTVIVPPVTLNPIGNLTVKAGRQLLLPCDVYGNPSPTLKWFHNGKELQPRSGMVFLDNALFIETVVEDDNGAYSCFAQNEAGSTWAHGNITVLLPPKIIKGPQNTTVLIGQPVVLHCSAHGFPKPEVYWLFNSSHTLPNGVGVSAVSHDLTISAVGWTHVGLYTCVARNTESHLQQSASLKVTVPPNSVRIVGSAVMDIGETLKLTCLYAGIPHPSLRWMHEGNFIQESLDGRISDPSQDILTVKFVTSSDAGIYSCQVTNTVGVSTQKIRVYVIEPPHPPVLTSAVAVSMHSVYLEWIPNKQEPMTNVTGYAVNMKYLLDADFVTFPGRLSPELTSYEVEGLNPGKEYIFTVSADNPAGLGKPSNALSVKTFESGPSKPRYFEVKKTDSTSIELRWEVPAVQNGDIRLYQLQYWEKSLQQNITYEDILNPTTPSQEYTVENLHPYTKYQVRVRAANIEGGATLWGNFTKTLEVETDMAVPSASPKKIEFHHIDPYTIQIKWTPLPKLEENGPLTGYQVSYKKQNQTVFIVKMVYNDTTTVISQLSPWTVYSFVVEAVNAIGHGPPSNEASLQTLPTAPTAAPQYVQGHLASDRFVTVTWQPPPRDKQNSALAGYEVKYHKLGVVDWKTVTTSLTTACNISDLDYWTDYEITVAAYTNQVTPGIGNYSDVVHVKTNQGKPGPVDNLLVNASTTSLYLHWSTPRKTNGVITYYQIVYYIANINKSDINISESQLKYPENKSVDTSYVTLDGLDPDTTYNISVSARTAAGEGTPVFVLQKTDQNKIEETSTEYLTTVVPEMSTYDLLTMDKDTKQQLPMIVAGSLTAGIVMFFILALIIYRCLKKRREEIRKYMTSSISAIKISKHTSGTYDRHFDEPANFGEDEGDNSTSSHPSHNPLDNKPDYGSCDIVVEPAVATEQTTASTSPSTASQSEQTALEVAPSGKTSIRKKANSFREDLARSRKEPVFSVSDMDNPVFHDEQTSATLPRPRTGNRMSADEFYSQISTVPRKNRMRSESAAAIAIMRNSNMTITTNDTDSLVANEAEVVFNERTVL